jgi:hypothetical protein
VSTASSTRLTTQVPPGATSGPITVTAPLGSATSPELFRIPQIAIFPTQTAVAVGVSRQFTATIAESSDQRVAWEVNGIEGGTAALGTISRQGLFSAPAEPVPLPVQVRARSVPFPQLLAVAEVSIIPPTVAVMAMPVDIRVVRPGHGEPGVPLNLTVAGPSLISVVRPGRGDPGGLSINLTLAAPPNISAIRPGAGGVDGLPLNVTSAAPSSVTVVRPGGDGQAPNVTVAQPHDVQVRRP